MCSLLYRLRIVSGTIEVSILMFAMEAAQIMVSTRNAQPATSHVGFKSKFQYPWQRFTMAWISTFILLGVLPRVADGATWTEVTVAFQPPPRANAGFIYDTQANRFVIFGGRSWAWFPSLQVNNNSWFNDVWFFSGSAWGKLDYGIGFDSFGPYPSQCRGRFVWNPDRNEALLSGGFFSRNFGYTVIFKDNNFNDQHPADQPPLYLEGGFYDPNDGCYYFVDNVSWVYKYNGVNWIRLEPANVPADGNQLYGGGTSFDPVTRQLVYYGGGVYPSGTPSDRTFIYSVNLNRWDLVSTDPHPLAVLFPSMAYHPDRGRHILTGGYAGEAYPGRVYEHVWEFNEQSLAWTEIPIENPRGLSDHSSLFNPADRNVYIFGGWLGDPGLTSDLYLLDDLPPVTNDILTPTPLKTATPSFTPSITSSSTKTGTTTPSPTITLTSTVAPTYTPYPTYTEPPPLPTYSPLPTYTDAPTSTPETTHVPGDLTGDGEVNGNDLIDFLRTWRQ
jgi:hypothetical protein